MSTDASRQDGLKGIRVFKGYSRDPDPVKRGPFARVVNRNVPSRPVPLKGNAVLEIGLDPETIEILSLVTEDDYYVAEIRGLFSRLYSDKDDAEQTAKFGEHMKKLIDREYVILLPEGHDDYAVADDGIDQVLADPDVQDAFLIRVTDAGRDAYFGLALEVVDTD